MPNCSYWTNPPDIAECAVFGVADELKGQRPVGLIVLKAGTERSHDDIVTDVVRMVRDRTGPVAVFKQAAVVARLPKTRSGKVLRGTMRKIANGEDYTVPATIEDAGVLDEIRSSIISMGDAAS